MSEATIALTIMTLMILMIFIGLIVWGIKSGQFRNVEDAKYRMLANGEDPVEENKQECAREKKS